MVMPFLRGVWSQSSDYFNRLPQPISGWHPTDIDQIAQTRLARYAGRDARPRELYALLRQYYANNSLYQYLGRALFEQGISHPAMKGLRNPAFRVVEFYVASLWPGALPDALPIETDNEAIEDPIRQVWTWSNWGSQKQVFARWLPMLGDCFIKVAQTPAKDRVYHQLVDPAYVVDFDTDERGFLTYCRIDVPIRRRNLDRPRVLVHTEVWSQEDQTFRRWESDQVDLPADQLGPPIETIPLATMGIDFVPIVHCQFRDVGEDRGVGAFTLSIDKIDQVNLQATRLSQQLFRNNSNTWAIESAGNDASGRPLPPLRVDQSGAVAGSGTVRLGDDEMLSLPGGYTIKSLVPALDYKASLDILNASMLELQADLPEMAFWRIPEATGEPSGRALRFLLAPALARADEARGNAHDALARADAMALTIGIASRLFDKSLGTFEAGDFEHTFTAKDVIAPDDLEEAQAAVQWWTAAGLQKAAGVSTDQILEERGYDEETIAEMGQAREADQSALNDAFGTLLNRQPGAVVPVQPGQPVAPAAPVNGNGASPATGGR